MTHDPIRRLLDEHVDLRARLEPLRGAIRELSLGGPERLAAALPALREGARLLTTDLIAHARREDEAFFPAVEEALGAGAGPTPVLREEHVTIHAGADRFHATLDALHGAQHAAIVEGGERLRELAAEGARADALRRIGAGLLDLVDDHFAKEEQVLFPLAREVLDAARLRAAALRMDELDGA